MIVDFPTLESPTTAIFIVICLNKLDYIIIYKFIFIFINIKHDNLFKLKTWYYTKNSLDLYEIRKIIT